MGAVTIPLSRSYGNSRTVKVSYTTYSRSAGTNDYAAQAAILTFAPGETSKNITISIFDDGRTEPRKEFTLELISASGGAWLGDQFTTTVGIISLPLLHMNGRPPASGPFSLTLSGAEGARVRIDGSIDLVDWRPLDTVTNMSGVLPWVDALAPQTGQRFYRAVVIP